MCTAVKGQAAVQLLARKTSLFVTYLDPDLFFYGSLEQIRGEHSNGDVLLTPHLNHIPYLENIILNDDVTNYSSGSALFSIPNVKPAVTTNHWTIDIVDTQDPSSFAWGYLKGVYTNNSSVITLLDDTKAYTQATALTKMTISLSTGTFSGGTALVYGVN